MGKKIQGAKLRAKKRSKVTLEELQEKQADDVAAGSVVHKKNEDLFVLDATGDVVPPSQAPSKKKPRKDLGLSAKDKAAVAKLVAKHDPEKLQALAAQGRAVVFRGKGKERRLRTKGMRGQSSANVDIWGADDDTNSTALTTTDNSASIAGLVETLGGIKPDKHALVKARRAKLPIKASLAVDVAKDGQSYHPDPVSHKNVVDRAFGVEKRRDDIITYRETPISQGLSAETRALMVGDTDSEDEESDQELNDGPVGKMPKRAEKLTRAERNKKQRLRQEQAVVDKRKKAKRLHNEVSEIPRYKKEMKRHKRTRLEVKEKIEETKRTARPLGKDVDEKLSRENPVDAPSLAVALSSELRSSLRTLKPKGSLVADRLSSLRDRKLAPKRAATAGKQRRQNLRKRKLAVKGRKNNEAMGGDFVVMG